MKTLKSAGLFIALATVCNVAQASGFTCKVLCVNRIDIHTSGQYPDGSPALDGTINLEIGSTQNNSIVSTVQSAKSSKNAAFKDLRDNVCGSGGVLAVAKAQAADSTILKFDVTADSVCSENN
jgi:hypothetical protein